MVHTRRGPYAKEPSEASILASQAALPDTEIEARIRRIDFRRGENFCVDDFMSALRFVARDAHARGESVETAVLDAFERIIQLREGKRRQAKSVVNSEKSLRDDD